MHGRNQFLIRALVLASLGAAAPALAVVEVLGVDGALAANVLAHLSLDEEPCEAPQWLIEQQQQAAPVRIRQALEALGYYEPRITAALERDPDCWRATFTIVPGEPTRIRGFDVQLTGEAASDPEFTAAATQSALASGAILSHGAYDELKRRWADLALERGYADARFVANRIDVYAEERVADVVLHFDSGVRYAFGPAEFRQDVLTDGLVRSYLSFQPGDPYDGRRLTELFIALAASGYFRSIDVRPAAPDRDNRVIPVDIALTSAARRQVTYGIGFSTDTGVRLRLGRNNRRFNDRGHQFGVNAQLSPVLSEVTANYRLPLSSSRAEWLNLDGGIEREDTESADSKRLEFAARRVRERPGDWTRSQLVTLRLEDFEVADQVGRSRLLMPGVDWTRIRVDNAIRARAGSKMSLQVQAAHDSLGSDTTFVQALVEGKWIWSLPRGARVLVRGQVGATAERSFEELPASVRFFAGGDNSVRGYDFESLGPIDENGEVIGGSALVTGSFEFEQPLRERWSLAVFVDSGNAFERTQLDTKTGAGLGGRWQSPVGPIRVDIAHPFDDDTDSWRLHISLGPDL